MQKKYTQEQAYTPIKWYCSYRERCHFEVKERLFGMGLAKKEVEYLICRLIEDGFLNEERFAIMFAGGHFRQKKWGKQKIVHALRLKKVGEPLIKRALKEIDEVDYKASIIKAAERKWNSLEKEKIITRKAKTIAYLLQKGYEMALIRETLATFRP